MQIKTPTELSAMEARKQFGELMNRAYYGGESFIIKRDDMPMVKIEPVYSDREKEKARERFFAAVELMREELAKHDPSEVDAAFQEALEAARSTP
jgi:antitoxin (DNA-binding transcriptional repressor) of toxin-antitoxin stability system